MYEFDINVLIIFHNFKKKLIIQRAYKSYFHK